MLDIIKSRIKNVDLLFRIISVFSGKTIFVLSQMVVPIFLTRILSVHNFGIYQNSLLFISFYSSLFSLGIIQSLYYFYPQTDNKCRILRDITSLLAILAILFLMICIILRRIIFIPFTDLDSPSYFFPLIVAVIANILALPAEHIMILRGCKKGLLYYFTIEGLCKLLLTTILAYLFPAKIYVILWGIAFIYIFQSIFVLIFIAYIKYENAKTHANFNYTNCSVEKQIRYNAPLALSSIINVVAERMDGVVLSTMLSVDDYAMYSAGKFRIPIVNLIFPSVTNVLAPRMVESIKRCDYVTATNIWHKMIIIFSVIIIPFFIFSELTAKELVVLLFTEKYSSSSVVYQIILFTFAVQIFSRGIVINTSGKTHLMVLSSSIAAIISLISVPLLINYYGIIGAAIGYVLAYNISGLIQVYYSTKILQLKLVSALPYLQVIKILVISLLCGLPILFLKAMNLPNTIFLGFSAVSFFPLAYILLHSVYTNILFKSGLNKK